MCFSVTRNHRTRKNVNHLLSHFVVYVLREQALNSRVSTPPPVHPAIHFYRTRSPSANIDDIDGKMLTGQEKNSSMKNSHLLSVFFAETLGRSCRKWSPPVTTAGMQLTRRVCVVKTLWLRLFGCAVTQRPTSQDASLAGATSPEHALSMVAENTNLQKPLGRFRIAAMRPA